VKVWAKGLNGTGQIIGVHDTGLDTSHCFFRDDGGGGGNRTTERCLACGFRRFYEPKTSYAAAAIGILNATLCNATLLDLPFKGGAKYTLFPNRTGVLRRRHNVSLAYDIKFYTAALTGREAFREADTTGELVARYCTTFALGRNDSRFSSTRALVDFCCALDPPGVPSLAARKSFHLPLHDRALALALLSNGISCCPNSSTLVNMELRDNVLEGGDDELGNCYKACLPNATAEGTGEGGGREPRKVLAYWAFSDSGDEPDGHGTHVSGSVAGVASDPEAPINAYKGMAHGAKLVFSDGSTRRGRGVWLPPDEASPMRWAYDMGARVHSNSWSDSTNAYGVGSAMYDELVHDRPDLLVLFAAGNDGDSGYGTLGTQQNAKNVLTVGAAAQPAEYELGAAMNVTRLVHLSEIRSVLCDPRGAGWAGGRLLADLNRVLNGTCGGGAAPAQNATFETEADAVAHYCPLLSGEEAGEDGWRAFACRVYNYNFSAPAGSPPGRDCRDGIRRLQYIGHERLSFGSVCLDRSTRRIVEGAKDGLVGERRMAFFSSRGPAADGRIKPDVSAPGYYVVSARADANRSTEQCGDPLSPTGLGSESGLLAMAGTSMATPVTAGAMTLVREYYVRGFHVGGVHNQSHGLASPSAALLRATAVAGAVPVEGEVEFFSPQACEFNGTSAPSTRSRGPSGTRTAAASGPPQHGYAPAPSPAFCPYNRHVNNLTDLERRMATGFGFLNLPSVLWFEGDSHRLTVVDSEPQYRLDTGDVFTLTLTFDHNASEPSRAPEPVGLRVVLAWSDPPASPAASKALVNDLDLRGRCAAADGDGEELLGNAETRRPGRRDSRNNVELIAGLHGRADRPCVVTVAGASVGLPRQDFALLVVSSRPVNVSVAEIVRARSGEGEGLPVAVLIVIVVLALSGALALVAGAGFLVRKWRRRTREAAEAEAYAMHEMLPSMENLFDVGDDEEEDDEFEFSEEDLADSPAAARIVDPR